MATIRLKSVKGRRFRITRLNECGAHIVGSCSSVVSSGFVAVTFTGEYDEGEEHTQKNAWGDFCYSERDAPRLKWVNVEAQFCEVNPDVADFIGGASVTMVTASSDTIGLTFGPQENGAAFALEVWTKLAGTACDAGGGNPYWGYTVAPFISNGRLNGPIEVAKMGTFNMRGDAQQAPSTWGVTPYADNPFLRTLGFPAGEFFGMVRTTVQPPAETANCAALA